jgi:hypothetical protein
MYTDVLDDPKVQKLPPALFKAAFLAACRGEESVFGEWVKPCNGRLAAKEWRALISKIYARDNYTCQYCGQRGGKLECDHVFPVSRGGSNDEDNLRTSCRRCNRAKRNKTLEELGWA